jgi:hypothetical protein
MADHTTSAAVAAMFRESGPMREWQKLNVTMLVLIPSVGMNHILLERPFSRIFLYKLSSDFLANIRKRLK